MTGIPILFGTVLVASIAVITEIRNERSKRLQEETPLRQQYVEKYIPEVRNDLSKIMRRLDDAIDSRNYDATDEIRKQLKVASSLLNETAKIEMALDFEVDTMNDIRSWTLTLIIALGMLTGVYAVIFFEFPAYFALFFALSVIFGYSAVLVFYSRIMLPYGEIRRFERLLRKKGLKKVKWID